MHPFKSSLKLRKKNICFLSVRYTMLAKHMRMQLSQLEAMNKEIEVRHARRANIDIRNKWQQAKTVKNYQSEYDRIRSHLGNSSMPYVTKQTVMNRKKTLEALGAKAFDFMK